MKMTLSALVATLVLASGSALAQNADQTFNGSGKWTRSYGGSSLTSNWMSAPAAQMSAVEDALQNCRNAGYKFCVYMTSRQNSVDGDEVVGSSTIRGTNKGRPTSSYQRQSSVGPGSNLNSNPFAQQAAKYQALEKATSACFEAGNDDCAILSAQIESVTSSTIEASASVVGIKNH